MGGEEFICLLPDTDFEGAQQLAERIRLKIEHGSLEISNQQIRMTASIGIAAFDPSIETEEETLLKMADDCLYQAKEKGRNRVEWKLEGA